MDFLRIPVDKHDIKPIAIIRLCSTFTVSYSSNVITPTPSLETIRPGTFDPANHYTKDAYQPSDHVANYLYSLSLSLTEVKPQKRPQNAHHKLYHKRSERGQKNSRNNHLILKSGIGVYSSVENKPESHLPAHRELTDSITPLSRDSVIYIRKHLTKAQARQQPI
ncbi:hypothetical protein N7532_005954 [Penicillium argentinense]|uniref:Uncharacterized protein n=1 Tax=Penicillium argentinense TaxID=1131581 RepID=A0A9W9KAF8_9EURO|nr:uncharacterized protein N7532_005954 [Penicillium argentinense]KAJ5098953.1 hypothetical protein N7532_005954 [Penicillium argentinense]